MKDIELVIRIPEEMYRTLNAKSQNDVVTVIDDALLIQAIKNGNPLPKGYGRLFQWWLSQKRRVRKKYTLFLGRYLSPKESREWYNFLTGRK